MRAWMYAATFPCVRGPCPHGHDPETCEFDQDSAGVTLPKDDLCVEGRLVEDGEIDGEHHIHIRHIDDGEWSLDLVDGIDS